MNDLYTVPCLLYCFGLHLIWHLAQSLAPSWAPWQFPGGYLSQIRHKTSQSSFPSKLMCCANSRLWRIAVLYPQGVGRKFDGHTAQ